MEKAIITLVGEIKTNSTYLFKTTQGVRARITDFPEPLKKNPHSHLKRKEKKTLLCTLGLVNHY